MRLLREDAKLDKIKKTYSSDSSVAGLLDGIETALNINNLLKNNEKVRIISYFLYDKINVEDKSCSISVNASTPNNRLKKYISNKNIDQFNILGMYNDENISANSKKRFSICLYKNDGKIEVTMPKGRELPFDINLA